MRRILLLAGLCVLAGCSGGESGGGSSGSSSSSGSSESGTSGKVSPTDAPKKEATEESSVPLQTTLDGKEMQVNQQYAAGERLAIPLLGVSFVVPPSCVAIYGSGGLAIVVRDTSKEGLGLVLIQTGMSKPEARWLLQQPLDLSMLAQGVTLQPQGEIEESGDRLSRLFSNGFYCTRITSVVAPHSAAAFSYVVPETDRERGLKLVSEMADSAKFAQPKDADLRKQWLQGLQGKKLHVFKFKSGGMGSNSWSSETNREWHFGSDGSYVHSGRTTNSASVETRDGGGNPTASGGFAADNDNNHAGKWRIEFNLGGCVLILDSTQGNRRVHTLTFNGRVYLDGDETQISQSNLKS